MRHHDATRASLLASTVILVIGCAAKPTSDDPVEAVAILNPAQGETVSGVVRFVTVERGVRVIAEVTGLRPNSAHGFHIHEFGDLTSPDFMSAGGHYNPEGLQHGGQRDTRRHAGDLGNIVADEAGRGLYDMVIRNITVAGKPNPVLGRSVVVHEKRDDLMTQPTGDAGGRIAAGVIGVASHGIQP